MRNARPFHSDILVNNHIGTMIFNVEIVVNVTHHVGCQCLPGCRASVHFSFKLSKHGLAENSAAETLQIVVEIVSPLLRVAGYAE